MARYHYTRENENGVVLYLESEPAEDAMDVSDDAIAVGFSGNGYLSFGRGAAGRRKALPNGVKYAAGGRCVITDTFTGEEKIWRWGVSHGHSGHPGGCPFYMHNMRDVWSFPLISCFSCLLVCQPAILIDSKRAGTEPAMMERDEKMKTLLTMKDIAKVASRTVSDYLANGYILSPNTGWTIYSDRRFHMELIRENGAPKTVRIGLFNKGKRRVRFLRFGSSMAILRPGYPHSQWRGTAG